uniref:Amino acid transporter transmembrane domain-containing protein n=1 Tax=Tetradesmus obliquus TaxID=3088 RepID=A0A383WBV8_TETOB
MIFAAEKRGGPVDLVADIAPDVEGKQILTVDDLVTEEFPPGAKKAPGETSLGFVKRVMTEGHTIPDALLSVAASQIGQVMLTCPNALRKAGVALGTAWALLCALLSLWTMFLLATLYLERKRAMLKQGSWFDAPGRRRIVTQYHEVVGYFLGRRAQILAQVLVALGLAGTSIAQIIACAGDMYYINNTFSKRDWELIWGGVLMVFAFVPTFRHFRVLNIIALLKQGSWFDAPGRRRIVTQYHEVVGYFLGRRAQILAQVLVALGLAGTSIAQIIACAGDMYYINNTFSKRDWELIWGGVLMVFAFVPTFRHFRVLNIIALVGTCYTAILILIITVGHGFSPQHVALMPTNAIDFFTGSAVLVSALGNHSIALEMMDAMQKGSQYIPAYFGGWLWSALLVLPHSIAVNYAFPLTIGKNDNVFGVLPVTTAVKASVWLMVIHQWVAFALYCTPLLYMWEKLIGTHTRPWFIRLPSRLPIVLLIYFLAVAFPFYGQQLLVSQLLPLMLAAAASDA